MEDFIGARFGPAGRFLGAPRRRPRRSRPWASARSLTRITRRGQPIAGNTAPGSPRVGYGRGQATGPGGNEVSRSLRGWSMKAMNRTVSNRIQPSDARFPQRHETEEPNRATSWARSRLWEGHKNRREWRKPLPFVSEAGRSYFLSRLPLDFLNAKATIPMPVPRSSRLDGSGTGVGPVPIQPLSSPSAPIP